PLSLISSIARASPRVIASPDCAEAPDKAATCPIFTGSAANAVPAANDKRTAVASIHNGAPLRSRNIEHLFHILISPSVQAWAETPFHIGRDYCPSARDRVEVPRGRASSYNQQDATRRSFLSRRSLKSGSHPIQCTFGRHVEPRRCATLRTSAKEMLVPPSRIAFDRPRGSCWMAAFIRSFSLTRINDDRQV